MQRFAESAWSRTRALRWGLGEFLSQEAPRGCFRPKADILVRTAFDLSARPVLLSLFKWVERKIF